MKLFTSLLLVALVAGVAGCRTARETQPAYEQAPPRPLAWPFWPTNEPSTTNVADVAAQTNRFVLPPPFLQLPEQKATREEIEKSGVAPELLQKMLQGQVLTLPEIEELAQKRVSETNIVKYLRSTGAVYLLTSRQVTDLQQAHLSEGLIDYLLSTPALYRDSALFYRYYYYPPSYSPGYWPWYHHDYHHYDHGLHHDIHH